MDPYALKQPNELLTLFTMMDGKTGNTYILKYIEGILENKGFDIVIEDNNYRLEPHIPVKKEKLYALPIEKLMELHHKLVNKTGTQHIPDKLRKTLIRRVNSILINRGCTTHKTPIIRPVILTSLKEAMEYAQVTGNNDWVVMSTMSQMAAKSIGEEVHKGVFGETPMDELSYNAREIVNKIKENVKSNKEKSMKNILIRVEKPLLVNYVYNEIRMKLHNTTNSRDVTMSGKFYAVRLTDHTISAQSSHIRIEQEKDEKLFTITSAANADIIIEEVIKEYNKVETKTFNLGGNFTPSIIPVVVYPDQVSFNNEYMTFDKFIALRNTLTTTIGGFKVGGVDYVLFTHNNGAKVYVHRDEFKPIIDAILCRLDA